MDNMADGNGNFITNQELLGKKNGSEHDDDDGNDRILSLLGRPPDLGSFPYLTSLKLITNKTKTSKFYPKYWPTKTEPFGSTSISLYENEKIADVLISSSKQLLVLVMRQPTTPSQ
jgi:hypothetical protein